MITGTGESSLDFSDLTGVSHREDNVQGSDKKRNEVEVPPSNGNSPGDGILNFLYKMRLLSCRTIEVYLLSCNRLKDMVRRFLDQECQDKNFDVRRDDRSAQEAAEKKDGKHRSRERKQRDCTQELFARTMF